MKVVEIFDKVEMLRDLQDSLKSIADRPQTDDRDEYYICEAIVAIDELIREFMRKEVKE